MKIFKNIKNAWLMFKYRTPKNTRTSMDVGQAILDYYINYDGTLNEAVRKKANSTIQMAKITGIKVGFNKIEIKCKRPGILIGHHGSLINHINGYVQAGKSKKKVVIVEDRSFDVESSMMSYNLFLAENLDEH